MGNSRSIKRKQAQRKSQPAATAKSSATPAWRRYAMWAAGLAALIVLVTYIVIDSSGEPAAAPDAPDAPEGTETFAVAQADHVTGQVSYPQDPPVGGPHNADSVPCGAYDTPLPNELAVHTLEHGVVWITYSPDLPDADIAVLAAKGGERKVMVSPYPGLDSPVVASAWARQLRLDTVNDVRIDQFIGAFVEGLQSPEPFVSC
jgi:hypothetical protein